MIACASGDAVRETEVIAQEIAGDRKVLVDALTGLGIHVVSPATAPFVLAETPEGTRERLREKGFALRRGDTFPGLGDDWVRIAVRDAATTATLVEAWRTIL